MSGAATGTLTRPDLGSVLSGVLSRVATLEQQVGLPAAGGATPTDPSFNTVTVTGGGTTVRLGYTTSTPTNLVLTPGSYLDTCWIDVSWTASSDGTDVFYDLQVALKNIDATYAPADVIRTSLTSLRVNNLRPNATYGFKVTPFNGVGVPGTSLPSSGFTDATTVPDSSPPTQVTGVTATAGLGSAIVTWNDNTEADVALGQGVYEIQRDTTNTFTSGGLETRRLSATIATWIGLPGGTTQYFRVRAIDSSGNAGAYSSTVSCTPSSTAPSSNLSDGNPPSSSPTPSVTPMIGALYAKWTAITNADPVSYDVHIGTTTGFTVSSSTLVTSVDATTALIKTDASGNALLANTNYYFRIVARDRDGSAAAGATSAVAQIALVTTADITDGTITTTDVGFTARQIGAPTTYVQSTTPTGALAGDLWIDTSNQNVLKRFDGTTWTSYRDASINTAQSTANTALTTAQGKILTFIQSATPTASEAGDLWVDTGNGNLLKRWSGTAWVNVQDTAIATAQSAANAAQSTASTALTTANGKNTVFIQSATPSSTGRIVGDEWIDTGNGNVLKGWNGSAWVNFQDASIATAQSTANSALTTATGKITTFIQNTAPSTSGRTVGDLWIDTGHGNQLNAWNGSAWTSAQDASIATALSTANSASSTANSALTAANGKNTTFIQATSPSTSGRILGDLWINTSSSANTLYGWNGTAWVQYQDASIASALSTANNANANANSALTQVQGKTTTFIQSTAPSTSGRVIGDEWINTGNGNALNAWNGSQWVAYQDTSIAAAQSTANQALASANASGHNSVFYQSTQPTGTSHANGDLWFDTANGYRMSVWNGTSWVLSQFSYQAISAIDAGTITVGLLTGAQIAAGTITASNITSGTITATQIAAGAITTSLLAAGAVTAAKIAANTITASQIATDTITATQIAAGAITASELAAGSVTASAMTANAVTAGVIAAGAVTAGTIAAGAVTAGTIAANAVTTSTIAAGAVTATQIAAGTITASLLAAGSVTANAIAAGAVIAGDIAANAVTAGTIAAGAVTTGTMSAGSINADRLTAGTIVAGLIAAATITGDRIAAGTITASNLLTGTITATSGVIGSIDASVITVGTLLPQIISAGSIDASKLTISSRSENLVPNGDFEINPSVAATYTNPAPSWTNRGTSTGSAALDTSTVHNGLKSLKLVSGANSPIALWSDGFEVIPGDTLSLDLYYRADAGAAGVNSVRYDLVYFTDATLNNSVLTQSFSYAPAANAWYEDTQIVTVPAGGRYCRMVVYNQSTTAGATVWFDDILVRKQVTSVLIQDGAVSATKIQAGSITSDKISVIGLDAGVIKFGTMTGDKIAANSLDAGTIKSSTLSSGNITINGGALYVGTNPFTNGIVINSAGIRQYQNGLVQTQINQDGTAMFQGTVTTAGIKSSNVTTGARAQFDSSGFSTWNGSNVRTIWLRGDGGTSTFTGTISASTVIGSIIQTTDPSINPTWPYIQLNTSSSSNSQLDFHSGSSVENSPAYIKVNAASGNPILVIGGSTTTSSGGIVPTIMITGPLNTNQDRIDLNSSNIQVGNGNGAYMFIGNQGTNHWIQFTGTTQFFNLVEFDSTITYPGAAGAPGGGTYVYSYHRTDASNTDRIYKGVAVSSSIVTKQDLAHYEVPVDKLLTITPKIFRYKTEVKRGRTDNWHVGVVGEELLEMGFDELVETDDDGEVITVRLERIGLMLIPIVKNLLERVAALEPDGGRK